jgi:hypothetical protein
MVSQKLSVAHRLDSLQTAQFSLQNFPVFYSALLVQEFQVETMHLSSRLIVLFVVLVSWSSNDCVGQQGIAIASSGPSLSTSNFSHSTSGPLGARLSKSVGYQGFAGQFTGAEGTGTATAEIRKNNSFVSFIRLHASTNMDGGVRATAGSATFAQYFDSFSIAGTDQPAEVSLRFEVAGQVVAQLTGNSNDTHGAIFSFSTTPTATGGSLDILEASALRAAGGLGSATNHLFLQGQALLARGDGFRVIFSQDRGFSELEVDDDQHFRGVFEQAIRRSNVSGLYEFVNTCHVTAESANGCTKSTM